MSDYGIGIAADNKSMQDGRWKFDSRKKKLTVDIEAVPKHLDLFTINGGTKWVLNPGDVRSEILFQVEHHMLFPPKFLFFALVTDVPSGFAPLIGFYFSNLAFLRTNNFPVGDEYVYADVDEKYFNIKHVAYGGGIATGTTITAYGSDYKFRVRYEILNQKAIFMGYPYFIQ